MDLKLRFNCSAALFIIPSPVLEHWTAFSFQFGPAFFRNQFSLYPYWEIEFRVLRQKISSSRLAF
jgi:hypothetical protein